MGPQLYRLVLHTLLFVCCLLASHIFVLSSGNVVRLAPAKTLTCLYENKTYLAGDKFKPDPCSYCHCPHRGGRVRCAIQDCLYEPNCLQHDRSEDECCGKCKRYGCLHTDDKLYTPGAEVLMSNCERCVCPEYGGRVVCDKIPCPRVSCVHPVQEEGQCCPSCPHGSNCWLRKKIIPADVVKRVGRCKHCQCPSGPPPIWMKGNLLKAVCVNKCE